LELNPNSAFIHEWYGLYLYDSGQMAEAEQELRIARKLDPLSLQINLIVAGNLYMERRYDEAVDQLRKTLELDPNFQPAYPLLEAAYREKGQYDSAVEAWQRALTLTGFSAVALSELKGAFRTGGIRAYWQKDAELLQKQAERTYVSPVSIAMDYSSLGEKDKAFEWLERAYQERSGWLLELKIDPVWDPLRSDPRFEELTRRVGIPD